MTHPKQFWLMLRFIAVVGVPEAEAQFLLPGRWWQRTACAAWLSPGP
jgi:hypothetical protein